MNRVQAFQRQRIERAMEKHSVDVIIASVPQHIRYLTGFAALGPTYHAKTQNYAVYYPAEKKTYIINSMSDAPTAFDDVPDGELVLYGPFRFAYPDESTEYTRAFAKKTQDITASPADSLIEVMRRIGADGMRVAWDELRTPVTTWHKVAAACPNTEFIPGLSLFEEARCVKHPEEIELLEKSCNIAEYALLAALEKTRVGDSEYDINLAYREEVAKRHGQTLFCTCTVDRRSSYSDTKCTRTQKVRDGSIIRFDYGAMYDFYCSDLARTVAVGKCDPEIERQYACIREGMEAAFAMMKPGVTASEVFQTALEATKKGFPQFSRHHCGHGIGLMINDIPGIAPGSEQVLEEGMVFCIETPYYCLDHYGIQVEDMVAVTADGIRRLNRTSNDLIYIPARM